MRITEHVANQLCISTRCRSVEHFVALFQRYVSEDAIFMSTLASRPQGLETAFVFVLANGTPVLRGAGVVRECWKTAENPFRLPGILLGIKQLSPRSVEIFDRMRNPGERNTLLSLAPPPPSSPWDEDSFVEATFATRPEVHTATTKQYFSPVRRAPAPEISATESFPVQRRRDTDARPCATPTEERGESFSAPTRLDARRFPWLSDCAELDAPSSDCILPLNPLASVSESALAGHIDCSVFESTHSPPIAVLAKVRRRPLWWGTVATAVAIVGVVVAVLPSHTSDARPEPEPPAMAEPTQATNGWPTVGDGPCRLSVFAKPAGSTVELDGVLRGPSPVTLAGPCGQHRVDVSHPTHRTMTAWTTLRPDQPESVEVALARAIYTVSVTSNPPQASIYIAGALAGRTPKVLNVLGHVPVTLVIKKPGYLPATRQVLDPMPRNKVTVRLTPIVSNRRHGMACASCEMTKK